VAPARLVAQADSVSVCLSKGLSAPVGSVVAGSAEFIKRARRNRKVLGGSMRQAGVFAAAGIVAITEMVERLADDHANARRLAHGLAQLDGIAIDPAAVETNILFFELTHPAVTPRQLADELANRGVKIYASPSRRMRMVTHADVSAADIDYALTAIADVLARG
jgi:threonine aldolase